MNRFDSAKEYKNAKKKGERELLYWEGRGKDGYLPSLEHLLQKYEISGEQYLGTIEIPLKKVKGTYYESRRSAFSKNFLPLLEETSEFAIKWMNLFEAQQEEGIREPIVAYEFLNYFYVVEGNKRASVLKYLEAPSIVGNVRRIIPKYDELDPKIRIYYEFLDFYEKTKINMIWFKREGSFKELEEILLKHIKETNQNPNEFFKYFEKFIYWNFRKVYHSLGGESLPLTTGDAFLEYIKKYGIEDNILDKELKARVKELIKELETVYLEEKKDLLHEMLASFIKLSAAQEKTLNIAFVYRNTINESTWVQAHEIGRNYIEEKFKDKIHTTYIENVKKEDSYEVIQELVDKNYNLIITTSFDFMDSTYKAAVNNLSVKFLNCAGYKSYRNLSVYFGRIYQPQFLTGMIAGIMTKSNKIGFIAPYPLPLFVRNLNAFAIGVKMVNPSAVIDVKWTKEWINYELEKELTVKLIESGNDIIASNLDTLTPLEIADEHNVYSIGYNIKKDELFPKTNIAAATWNWGPFYEKIVKKLLNDEWEITTSKHLKDLRKYWYGMDRKIVRLFKSKNLLPGQSENLIELMKNAIKNREYDVFSGPIIDANGNIVATNDESITDEELLKINWYLDNIKGELEKIIFTTD
ncbi:hypothetical protein XO10_10030 [Marinitoga sp. 1135]|uniref:Putative ABC-type transport system, periplasmic component/surface lipoprotein n=1 Tax=Marinitoga piezophila (strain DSM 14283 / JCM 11233 / KA3) TaxID=443254 RepID=H2J740_MARPK|nr:MULTISPECIES: BMP family ABC transporter substrate-binding protein [Marinitoga]AEX86410.1 putative ABC-type transport system, periplasmic component/surface lipoprotein [Marinitoga piezophila KA3]APT76800.1 hypothetical protein LN42_10750 [Marinitoga sp. 1137]NUU96568.1 hypothetical protein [Marinitoga sp. 1135]